MLTKLSSEDTSSSGLSSLDYDNFYSYYADAPHRVEVIGNKYYRYDLNGNLEEERVGGHRSLQDYDQAEYNFRDNVTVANQAFAWDIDGGDDDDVYSRQFEWDEENRLKATVDPNHWTVYRYDQDGERTLKYSDLGETLYFDSMWSVCDTESTDGLRQSKNIYVGETRIATKLNFPDSDLGYEKLNTYYYHTDHLSSSNVVTDPDGEVYEHLEYTPYGEMWIEDQKAENLDKIPFRFTSKEWDEETGLYYMSARYQNPMTSRWISADPAGFGLVNPMGDKGNLKSGFSVIENVNWYSYSSNNPLRYVDPSGLDDVDAITGAQPSSSSKPEWLDNKAINQQLYQTNMENDFSDKMKDLRGTPYDLGGNSTDGTDCSGSVLLALEQMGFDTGDMTANTMASGDVPWIEILDPKSSVDQGTPGILNFYSWGKKKIQHVNAGVGSTVNETNTQVIDATEGDWMTARNGNTNQIYPAQAGSINQTYVPYSTRTKPDIQGRINFNAIPRK
ncbi:RHS repeat-associated core domain-containing protein [Oceanispirochaeta crateris]|nr:RHS repeat-associated core domain-containing protein [Oceanispirochaeta crateris]